MSRPKGYWTNSGYVGFMPDGSKRYFESYGAYIELFYETLEQT